MGLLFWAALMISIAALVMGTSIYMECIRAMEERRLWLETLLVGEAAVLKSSELFLLSLCLPD